MIPVKDARKLLYLSMTEKSLADFQTMYAGVIAVELLSEAMSGDLFYAVEFSPEVDGLTLGTGAFGNISMISGNILPVAEIAEGAKIPFYFINYISD